MKYLATIIFLILFWHPSTWASVPSLPTIPYAEPSPVSPGTTYYVYKDHGSASDGNACTSESLPCASIIGGLGKMSATNGDILVIKEATTCYTESGSITLTFTGDATHWTTIRGASGESPQICLNPEVEINPTSRHIYVTNLRMLATSSGWRQFYIHNNVQDVFLEDLEIDGNDLAIYNLIINNEQTSPGVTNVYIDNLHSHNSDQHNVKINAEADNIVIVNSTIHDTQSSSAGDCISGGTNPTDHTYHITDIWLEGNEFYGCAEQGVDIGGDGVDVIAGNKFHDVTPEGLKIWSAEAWIYNNEFYDLGTGAITFQNMHEVSGYGAAKVFLLHNTIDFTGATRAILRQQCVSAKTSVEVHFWIYDNIFFTDAALTNKQMVLFVQGDTDATIEEEDHNIYFGQQNDRSYEWKSSGTCYSSWGSTVEYYTISDMVPSDGTWTTGGPYAGSGNGTHDLAYYDGDGNGLTEPGFKDLPNDDYSLDQDSIAIDVGTNVNVTDDINGVARPQNDYDMGAYEEVVFITVTATDDQAAEESQDTGYWTISCTPFNCSSLDVNFSYGGDAVLDTDYDTDDEDGTIMINGASATITLTPVDDSDPELGEVATLTITSGTGYTVGTPASDSINIADNDGAQSAGVAGMGGLGTGTGQVIYDSSGSGSWTR